MTEQHTPGPWSEGVEGSPRVYGPDGMGEHSGLVANVFKGRANVRLIATAPELLALAVQYRDDLRRPPTGDSLERRIAAVSQVIAKAVFG